MRISYGRLITVSVLTLALAACVGDTAEDLVVSAKSYLAKKDSKAAVIQLKNALQKKSDSAETRFLLGKTLLELGDPSAASAELRRALDLKFPLNQTVPLLAKSLLASRQYKTIVVDFSNISLTESSANADLKTSVASANAALGNNEMAQSALRSAFESAPDYPAAMILNARMKADRRQFNDALGILERVLVARPTDVEAWQFKGEILQYAKSDTAGAKDAYETALRLRQNYLPARASMLSLLLAQRDLSGAAAQLNELKKAAPDHPQTTYFEAQLAYLSENNERARDLIQQLLKVAAENPKVLQLAGAVAFNAGSLLQAESYLTKALQIMPELPIARSLLAQTELRSGQPNKALTTLEPLLRDSEPGSEAYSLAAQAYLQTGQLGLAEQNFERAARANPRDTRSRTALALARMTESNADATFSELRAISSDDTNTYADMALVSAHLRRGDLDRALKAIDALETKQPGKPLASYLRGRVLTLKKDSAAARTSFERALLIDPVYVPAAASLADLDLSENKQDLARKRFETVLASDPKNMRALLAIAGLTARAGGSKEEVAKLLGSVVNLYPAEIAPRLLLVDHYLVQKDPKMALVAAQNAVVALPDSVELLDALGRAQLGAGDINQSINSFNKLTNLKPDSPEAYLRLAGLYITNKNSASAEYSLKRALAISPNLLIAQQSLIDLYISAKKPEDALQIARTVQKQRPLDPSGFILEGTVEASRQHWTSAAASFRAALDKSPKTEIATKLHSVLASQQKESEAEAFAVRWLSERPNDPGFLFYMGEVSLGKGHYTAAEDYFKRVITLKPQNALALNNLAWVTTKLIKPGAVDFARKACELLPNTPAFMDTLAISLAAEHQVAEAIEIEKKALALSSDSPFLRLNLAKLHLQAGDKRAARSELEELSKLNGRFASQAEVAELLKAL